MLLSAPQNVAVRCKVCHRVTVRKCAVIKPNFENMISKLGLISAYSASQNTTCMYARGANGNTLPPI